MTEGDRPLFAEALHVLGETFNETISDVRAEAYFRALQDLPIEVVNAAVLTALRTSKFFPKPVEVRDLVFGNVDSRADAAWSAVIREIRRVGYVGTPSFDDSRVLDAVRDVWGGWARLCETLPAEGPELVGWIKQFKSAYRSVDARSHQPQLPATALPTELQKRLESVARSKDMPRPKLRAV